MRKNNKAKDGRSRVRFFEYLIGVLSLALIFFITNHTDSPAPKGEALLPSPPPTLPAPLFTELPLEAKAVYVFDVTGGKALYAKNAETQLPLASLTKIMTAVVTLGTAPGDTPVTLRKDFFDLEGGGPDLYPEERWRLSDLLSLTLVESSNVGAYAIASVAGALGATSSDYSVGRQTFVGWMNTKARELNLTQTYFLNPTGLDQDKEISGGYGSARDIAVLFAYAIIHYPKAFETTNRDVLSIRSLSDRVHEVKNTNTEINKFPLLLASKTGYTDLAGGNLVIAFDVGFNHPVVVAVLGSTFAGRFSDALRLAAAAREYLTANPS